MAEPTRLVLEAGSPAIRRGELVEDVGLVRTTGEFIALLETGWDVPCHTIVGFRTRSLDQQRIIVAFHRRAPGPGDSQSLGEVAISVGEPTDPEDVAVNLSLGADIDSLWVSAASLPTGEPLAVTWCKRADA